MKRPWLIVALLLSVGVNIGVLLTLGVARARGPEPRQPIEERDRQRGQRPGQPGAWVTGIADRLGLEGDDRDRFAERHQQFFESSRSLRGEVRRVRRTLREEVMAPEPDQQRIDELLAASSQLTAQMDRLFAEHVLATRELLDPRQQRLYFGMLSRMGERAEHGADPRGRRPPRRRGEQPDGPGPSF